MKRLVKILSVMFTVVMLCALVLLMCMGWLNISGKAFHIFGYALLRVQSASMAPEYEEGDFLLSRDVSAVTLTEGDVITFYSRDPNLQGMLNTHRITAIEQINGERVFTTKGDAAEEEDKYKVYSGDIFGKVTGKIGFLKTLARFLAIPWIFAAVIFFPLLLLIISEARNIIAIIRQGSVRKQLEEMGLNPDDPAISAIADKYGIEIFINAAKELEEEKAAESEEDPETNESETNEAETNEAETDLINAEKRNE